MTERFLVEANDTIHAALEGGLCEYDEDFDAIIDSYVAFRNMMNCTKCNGSKRAVDIELGIKMEMLQLMLDVATRAGLTIKAYKKPEYQK